MRTLLTYAACCAALALAAPAQAIEGTVCAPDPSNAMFDVAFGDPSATPGDAISPTPWRQLFVVRDDTARLATAVSLAVPSAFAQEPVTPRPRAVQLSRGYEVRLKVHRLASWLTAPLFVAQYIAGQKLYDADTPDEGTKDLHGALAMGTTALFGVNTATGVWNLWEGRKRPEGRTRRIVHSILMLGADAGFVATGLMAPDDDEDEGGSSGSRSAHRNVAIASMGVAAVSYVYMLVTR